MQPEDLLSVLGTWGRFHSLLMAVLAFPIIQNGFQVMMVIITLAVPSHRCRIPGLDNDTFDTQSEWHRHMVDSYIPSAVSDDGEVTYDSCHLYVNASGYDVSNASHVYVNLTKDDAQTVPCHSWVYDQSEMTSTVMTYFDLVCGMKGFRAHFNVAFIVGLFIGSPLAGWLCDSFGRKPVLFAAILLNLVFNLLSAFPYLEPLFLVYRVFTGASGVTVYIAIFVLLVESVGPEMRTTMGSLVPVIWIGGPALVGGVSYVLRDWQYLQIIAGLINVITLFCWRLVPESPMWLLSKGRTQEAVDVVREAARLNGKTLDLPAEVDKTPLGDRPQHSPASPSPSHSVRQMLRYPRLVVRTLIVFFNWSAVSMTYYGLSLNVSNLAGSVRVNFLLSSAVELLGYLLAWGLLVRLGRKRTLCGSMMLAGIACLATIFPGLFLGDDAGWVTMVLAMVGKMGISAAFASVYLVSAELFPTAIRNLAMGCSSTAGRVGSLTSPYIADLSLYIEGPFGQMLPLIILGGMTVTAALLSLLLPETLGRTLPDSVEDAAEFGQKTKKKTGMKETEMGVVSDNKQARPLLDNSEIKT